MRLPALEIRSASLQDATMAAERVRSSRVRNQLLMEEMRRRQEADALAGEASEGLMGGGNAMAQPGGKPLPQNYGQGLDPHARGNLDAEARSQGYNAVAAAPAGEKAQGIPKALRRLAAINPRRAQQLVQIATTLDDRQIAKADRMARTQGALAIGVLEAPQDQRPAMYQRALQQAQQNGMDVSKLPPQYGPEAQTALELAVLEAMSFKDALASRPKTPEGFRTAGEGLEPVPGGPKDPAYIEEADRAKARTGTKAPARVREAQWLVDQGIYKTLGEAYKATRERVSMGEEETRAKALTWVSAQKNRYGKPKYTTPEQQQAALAAYERFVQGDAQGAVAALKALEPEQPKDEPGWIRRTIKDLFGSAKGEKGGGEGAPPAGATGKTRKAQDGQEYPAVSDQAGYDALPPGAVYYHAGRKEFLTKGQ